MKKMCISIATFFCLIAAGAQKQKVDSFAALLTKEKVDTNRVIYMWQMAGAIYIYNPDSAILLAQKALFLPTTWIHLRYI